MESSTRARRRMGALAAGLLAASSAFAETSSVSLTGAVESVGEYEYGTAQPLPPGTPSMLPIFAGARSFEASFSFDPAQAVDLDPSPTRGSYLVPGTFTLRLPDVDVWVHASGNVGFDVQPGQGFGVSSHDIVSSSGTLNPAYPFSISGFFYTSALTGDQLPTSAFPWQVANLYIDVDGVTPPRDFFILAYPVPEPGVAWLMLAGGGVLAAFLRRRRFSGPAPAPAPRPAAAP